MKEPRQANCSFITYFPGQTRSVVFSLKNKRKKQPQKTAKKAFQFLAQQSCCLSSGTGVWDSAGSGSVAPGALCACPHGHGTAAMLCLTLVRLPYPKSIAGTRDAPRAQCLWCAVALDRNWGFTEGKYPAVLKLPGPLLKSFHTKSVHSRELKRQIGWEESTVLPGATPSLLGEQRAVTSSTVARSTKMSPYATCASQRLR